MRLCSFDFSLSSPSLTALLSSLSLTLFVCLSLFLQKCLLLLLMLSDATDAAASADDFSASGVQTVSGSNNDFQRHIFPSQREL
jgi:hypothetical protein